MSGNVVHDVRITESGAGEAVLLLSGFDGDGGRAWASQISLLEREHRVIRYVPQAVTLAGRAAEALAVLDALGVGRAHVLGSSLGAAVAQRIATDRPDRVRALVLSGSWARSDRALRAILASWLWTLERASLSTALRSSATVGSAPGMIESSACGMYFAANSALPAGGAWVSRAPTVM